MLFTSIKKTSFRKRTLDTWCHLFSRCRQRALCPLTLDHVVCSSTVCRHTQRHVHQASSLTCTLRQLSADCVLTTTSSLCFSNMTWFYFKNSWICNRKMKFSENSSEMKCKETAFPLTSGFRKAGQPASRAASTSVFHPANMPGQFFSNSVLVYIFRTASQNSFFSSALILIAYIL